MKLIFLDLPIDERRLYFQQAAIQRNVSPVVMEKDFSHRPSSPAAAGVATRLPGDAGHVPYRARRL
jgi:hypothetical protein